jgi:hypothetical protein
VLPALAAIGSWFSEHGYSLFAGFIGGTLASIVHDRWRIVRRRPPDEPE